MKIVMVFLLSFSITANAIDDDCENKQKPTEEKIIVKPSSINGDYINLIARQIFNDETGLYDFIGVDCNKLYKKKMVNGLVSLGKRQQNLKKGNLQLILQEWVIGCLPLIL